jgi:hypothetical protein
MSAGAIPERIIEPSPLVTASGYKSNKENIK